MSDLQKRKINELREAFRTLAPALVGTDDFKDFVAHFRRQIAEVRAS